MAVAVFGSINMDFVVRSPTLPVPGQTLTGHSYAQIPGGKGANQAVACAQMGVETFMFGRLGDDALADGLRNSLSGYGVKISNISTTANMTSGVAMITVSDSAENTIIVVPAANHTFDESDIERLEAHLDQIDVLLLQLEIPLEWVVRAAKMAHDSGVRVVLDPAPAWELPEDLYPYINILTPNETEAAALVGYEISDAALLEKAARDLLGRGVQYVVMTLGADGLFWASRDGSGRIPTYEVTPVDTVAAGDAFNGGLASALSEGLPFPEALRRGLASGALATTKPGAQPAMPSRQEVLTLMGL